MKRSKQASGIKDIKDIEGIDLKSLTVDDLLELRDNVAKTLSSRVEAERRNLEARLARLRQADLRDPLRVAKGGRVIGRRATVAPKYRNPDNPSETWSGRGRKPRWLTAAIKSGKKLRDLKIGIFSITFPLANEMAGYFLAFLR